MFERRRAHRTHTSGIAARVKPGHRVDVVDVSVGGALLESGERTPEEEVEISLQQEAVRHALERLPERER